MKRKNYHSEPEVNTLDKFLSGILLLGLATSLVTTPEQRARWVREADWNHYASKYAD